jgi:hypothetical protein
MGLPATEHFGLASGVNETHTRNQNNCNKSERLLNSRNAKLFTQTGSGRAYPANEFIVGICRLSGSQVVFVLSLCLLMSPVAAGLITVTILLTVLEIAGLMGLIGVKLSAIPVRPGRKETDYSACFSKH